MYRVTEAMCCLYVRFSSRFILLATSHALVHSCHDKGQYYPGYIGLRVSEMQFKSIEALKYLL